MSDQRRKIAGQQTCPLCHGRQKRPVGRSSIEYANCTNCDGAGWVVRAKNQWRPYEPCKEET